MKYVFVSFFLIFITFTSPEENDFNPCNIDDSACMPLEDFEHNCTCILLPDENAFNVTDEVYLFMTGYPIHMSYITQIAMADLFREKLSIRIPQAHYYDTASEFDQNIYRNMEIDEKMGLFVVDTAKSQQVFDYLVDNKYLRTTAIAQKENRWCLEGECNAFVYESNVFNRTEGIYSHAADLLQIIEYRGRSIFALSSAFGKFSVPKAQQMQCEHKCKVFYWSEHEMCMKQCRLRKQFDQVAITGDLKRNFDFFIQSSAIQNFRNKYKKYIKNYPNY